MSNSKAIIQDSVSYSGFVKFVYKNSKGKSIKTSYHNEGKLPLFTSACRALAGYSIEQYKPFYIMLYTYTGETTTPEHPISEIDESKFERALASNIVYTATPTLYQLDINRQEWIKNVDECDAVEYVFTIPVTTIAGKKNDSTIKINKLALLNKQGKECADVILGIRSDDPPAVEIETAITTSNILVYWKLLFIDNDTDVATNINSSNN